MGEVADGLEVFLHDEAGVPVVPPHAKHVLLHGVEQLLVDEEASNGRLQLFADAGAEPEAEEVPDGLLVPRAFEFEHGRFPRAQFDEFAARLEYHAEERVCFAQRAHAGTLEHLATFASALLERREILVLLHRKLRTGATHLAHLRWIGGGRGSTATEEATEECEEFHQSWSSNSPGLEGSRGVSAASASPTRWRAQSSQRASKMPGAFSVTRTGL